MGITVTGQAVIRWISRHLNDYMNRIVGTENQDFVIAGDTDSAYLNFTPFVNKFLAGRSEGEIVDALCKVCDTKFQDQIKIAIDQLATRLNVFENHMDMKREAIGQAVFVAKKRYIMRVFDQEGVRYEHPEMKAVGLEAVRTTVPEFCRKSLKETYELIFTGGQNAVIDKIDSTREKFKSLPLYEIGMPTGVHNLDKWAPVSSQKSSGVGEGSSNSLVFQLKTPSHIKATFVYNWMLEKLNLTHKYESIKDEEKVKVVILKTPNPTIVNDRIAFPTVLPPEFGLDKYVDIESQFDATYLSSIKRVLDSIGWKTDRSVSLDSFFD